VYSAARHHKSDQYIDILSYWQRLTTALPIATLAHKILCNDQLWKLRQVWQECAGMKSIWCLFLYQQGTYAPGDGVHRWMERCDDKNGNIAVGYAFPTPRMSIGIRYTDASLATRWSDDPR
jgi:hypothetical protein